MKKDLLKNASERLFKLDQDFNRKVVEKKKLEAQLKQIDADIEAIGGAIQDVEYWRNVFVKLEDSDTDITAISDPEITDEQIDQAIQMSIDKTKG